MADRREYTQEFKREAVRLSNEAQASGKKVSDIASELGVKPKILYRWRAEFRALGNDAFPGHGIETGPEAELRKAQRELARSQQECEILKKALAIFSQDR